MTSDLTGARPEARRGRSRSALVGWLWSGALLVVLTFLVVYPVAMLLLGALTNTNPVVDGFGVFNLSLANFITVLGNPERPPGAGQLADRLRRRHGAGRRHRADVLLGGGAHQHAVQALHRGRQHAAAVRAAAGRRGRLVDPRLAAHRACSTRCSAACGIDWRFNVYSMGGLICIFGIYYAPYVYMFTASALRNMDPALEEAAEVTGATRAAHAVHRDLPADRAGHHLRHAAVVHRHARHLRHPGGARHARRHPGADHLHLQAHQLVAAALQHGRLGRDHPDGGHGLPGLAAAQGDRRGAATRRSPARRSAPALLNLGPWRYFTLGAGGRLPVRRRRAADAGADRRGVPQVPVHPHHRQPVRRAPVQPDPFRAAVRQSAGAALDLSTPWRSG